MPETKELSNFDSASCSDTGRVRQRNEDYFGHFDTINGHVFVVCDGMGGHKAGDKASQFAVSSVKFFFSNFYYKNPVTGIKDAILYANKYIFDQAIQNREYETMGTTIVLAVIRNDKIYYGHVGDSRIYLMQKNNLIQLTKDHSYINKLIENNIITHEEAFTHPRRNELTRALGIYSSVEVDVCEEALEPQNNDWLLLCTDGLTNHLTTQQIKDILYTSSIAQNAVLKLTEEANKNGGTDNITVQAIRFFNISTSQNNLDTENDIEYNTETESEIRKKSKINYLIISTLIVLLIFIGLLRFDFSKPNGTKAAKTAVDEKTKMNRLIHIQYQANPDYTEIADLFEMPVNEIIALNKFQKKNKNNIFVRIYIRKWYIVNESDDLEIIAQQYGVTVNSIVKINNLTSLKFAPGQRLIIPNKIKK